VILLNKVKIFAKDQLSDSIFYHTKKVLECAKILADNWSETIEIGIWLHDIGITKGKKGHHEEGCNITLDFLKKNNYNEEKEITIILDIIKNHGTKGSPKTKECEIVKCADKLWNFDDDVFKIKCNKWRKETNSKEEFRQLALKKIDEHYNNLCKKGKDIAKEKYKKFKEVLVL